MQQKKANKVEGVHALLNPRNVAIVGASDRPGNWAGGAFRALTRHNFPGAIYPVNPRNETVWGGLKCYPSLSALPEKPDHVIIVVPGPACIETIREAGRAGARSAQIFSSGFGEGGDPKGRALGVELAKAIEESGVATAGPNCMGNFVAERMMSASDDRITDLTGGPVAVFGQSGGVVTAIVRALRGRGLYPGYGLTTGNEVGLTTADYIRYFAQDPSIKVMACYMESIKDPADFRDACATAQKAGKPIVAFKVGRSEAGALSAVSHTGALAGADALYEALFRQTGVIRANAFSDLLDIAVGLASGRRLEGKRLGVLTTTGGAGALIADACGVLGFTTPAPDSDTASRLGKLMIGDGAVPDRNPIDLTLAGLRPDIMSGAIGAIMSSPSYDGAVVIVGSSGLDRPDLVANAARENIEKYAAPLAIYVSPSAPHIVRSLNQKGIPAFDTPEGCAAALAALTQPQRSPAAQASNLPAVEITASGKLDEHASKRVLAQFGIHAVEEHRAASPHEAEAIARRIGAPVAIKILSSEIAHKTDVGGVMLDVAPHDVGQRCAELAAKTAGLTGANPEFLVQRFVRGAIEMLLGVVRDDRLGAAIVLGSGGTGTELLDDTSMRMAPLSRGDVEEMIGELRMRPMLFGYRGRAHADVEALIAATLAFSDFVVAAGPRLVEAEINPLFVLPLGEGALAADALLVLR